MGYWAVRSGRSGVIHIMKSSMPTTPTGLLVPQKKTLCGRRATHPSQVPASLANCVECVYLFGERSG
jgi:hypothetical protein